MTETTGPEYLTYAYKSKTDANPLAIGNRNLAEATAMAKHALTEGYSIAETFKLGPDGFYRRVQYVVPADLTD